MSTPTIELDSRPEQDLDAHTDTEEELTVDALVEDVSIDGMCGVY